MYIYGVLNSDKEFFFGPHGVTACEEVYPHTKDFGVGVYTVSYQDISAVVSDSEVVDYTRMRKDVLAMFLVRHQKAIEKIMGLGHAIIPMRLGTFTKDEAEIKHILACGHSIIKDIFTKISNMIEIDVTATWGDFNSALKEIGECKEIKEFKERLLVNPKAVTVDDQMKIGLMVKEALDRMREGYSKRIQASLKSV
ncbi:MAG: GvpL/GvpF family gas vesicle protein, partial [Nanoarchaeota archaeon]